MRVARLCVLDVTVALFSRICPRCATVLPNRPGGMGKKRKSTIAALGRLRRMGEIRKKERRKKLASHRCRTAPRRRRRHCPPPSAGRGTRTTNGLCGCRPGPPPSTAAGATGIAAPHAPPNPSRTFPSPRCHPTHTRHSTSHERQEALRTGCPAPACIALRSGGPPRLGRRPPPHPQ